MIGNATSGASFHGLAGYLAKEQARVSFTDAYNLLADETDAMAVAEEMTAVAEGKDRCKKPVYHLSLSWHPEDEPTDEEMQAAAERVLQRLGLEEHQALVVGHNDTEHAHVHMMVNRVHHDPERLVWGGWKDGRPWTNRAIEHELRALEQEMGWTVTPGFNAPTPGREPPERGTTGSRRRLSFGAEITVTMGPTLQNARCWRELAAALDAHGLRVEARPKGMVITDGNRYIGACRIRGLKGGRPDLEDRFGQPLDDFLETGESPEPASVTDWVWKVRMDSLYHARRHFNKTPELYAIYQESLLWRAQMRQEAERRRAERELALKRRALLRAERAAAEAARTRRVLLYSLQGLLRGYAGLEAAAALAGLTMALTRLGIEGALAVLRHRPQELQLPSRGRIDDAASARLATEVRDYAAAQAAAPSDDALAALQREVSHAEASLRAVGAAARQGPRFARRGPDVRRQGLSWRERAAIDDYERRDGLGREDVALGR